MSQKCQFHVAEKVHFPDVFGDETCSAHRPSAEVLAAARPTWRAPRPSSGVLSRWACCLASRVRNRDHVQSRARRGSFSRRARMLGAAAHRRRADSMTACSLAARLVCRLHAKQIQRCAHSEPSCYFRRKWDPATTWGRGVQARLRGSWRRTGSQKGLQDTQPANCQPTSGCPSLLSLLFVPKICMLTYIHVHTYIHLYTYIYISIHA